MSLDAPSAPNPVTTAAQQQQENLQAAQQQAEINDVNQVTPYGTLTYQQTGTNADGTPQYTATTQLSPQEQGLLNATLGTQQTIASDAGTLANNISGSLTNAPNLSNADLTNTMMNWQQQYMQPIFNQQQSNLNAQLAAQGITQGSAAYDNAENLQARNVDNAYENAMATDEGQAYNQALTTYQAPIQTLGTLLGEGSPASVNSSLVSTPTESIQPANISGLTEQNYAQQNQNYDDTLSGIFGVGSALAGGWAKAGGLSDRRAKKDICQVGFMFDGTLIYRFRYKHDDELMQIGVMAQDIENIYPDAVHEIGGVKHVDYAKATACAARIGGA